MCTQSKLVQFLDKFNKELVEENDVSFPTSFSVVCTRPNIEQLDLQINVIAYISGPTECFETGFSLKVTFTYYVIHHMFSLSQAFVAFTIE